MLSEERINELKDVSISMMDAMMMLTKGPNEAIVVLALMSSYINSEHSSEDIPGSLNAFITAVTGLVEKNH